MYHTVYFVTTWYRLTVIKITPRIHRLIPIMQIKKPRSSAYIRLVLLPSSHTVYKVDTLSQYAIIGSNRTVLHFATPKAALSMNGSYAILIDHGAVVGQGCSYDGPPTPGITSTSDWGFTVDGVCPVGYSLAPPGFTNCAGMSHVGILSIREQ